MKLDSIGIGAPRSTSEARQQSNENAIESPAIEQTYIRYGMISKVSKNNFVKVVLLNDQGQPEGKEIADERFLPVNTPLSSVLLQFGPLRVGLVCRVFWKDNREPNASSTIDIIGDEEHNFLAKEPYPSDITIGPYKIFSGGMLI